MKTARVLLFALSILAVGHALAQGPRKGEATEQHVFSAEDATVEHSIPIPDAAFAILVRDERLANLFDERVPITSGIVSRAWFSAATVHLGGKGEKDIIIMGIGPVRGANVTSFWIFRPRGTGFELIVAGAVAHTLEIMQTRTNGYCDIDTFSATAVDLTTNHLRFRDGAYRLISSEVDHLK
jgi:hypothetical protein